MDQTAYNFQLHLLLVALEQYRANTVVPDAFGKYNDHKAKGYTLDLKKANKLLDN